MKSRSTLKRATLGTAIAFGFLAVAPQSSNAATLFWDNGAAEAVPLWNTPNNWDMLLDGTGGDPGAAPTVGDIASFNVTPLNTAQTLFLDANYSVDGIEFNSTGDVSIVSATTQRLLTIGASGIMKTSTAAGVTTFGAAASSGGAGVGVRNLIGLSASQTWTNNAVDPLSRFVFTGSAASTTLSPTVAGETTLTLTGTNTGLNRTDKIFANGSGTLSIIKNGPGTWVYGGGVAATYSGGLTINEGLFIHGFTTNASGLGTGTLTLNGGELRGGQSNMTVTNAINVTANSTISPTRFDLVSGLTVVGFNGAFTSPGTLGNGPVLTIDQHNLASPPTTTLGGAATGSWSGFNGTLNLKQSTASAGTIQFTGTTPAGNDLSNAKLLLATPNNSPIGVNRVDILSNSTAGVTTFNAGELSGSGYIAFRGAILNEPYTLKVGHLGSNSTFTGDIRHFQTVGVGGALSLNKVGTGSLTVTGNSDYTNGTIIENGTLIAGTDARITTIQPTDAKTQLNGIDANSVFTANEVTGITTFAPTAHGLVDGDRIMVYRGLVAAEHVVHNNKPYYVKFLTNETFELYNNYDGVTFSDKALFAALAPTVASSFPSAGARVTMGTSLGVGTSAIALGTGTDSNNVSLLAGSADANLSVTIARNINVAANTGGTSTIGSSVDGNSVFSGAITLGKNVEITSASAGANTLTVSGQISGTGFGVTKVGTGNATLSATNTYTGDTTVSAGTLDITGSHTTGANYSVAANANLITNNVRAIGSLTVDGTATINTNGGAPGASKAETFAISAGGKLNLKDNDLVVGTAANVNAVRTAIKTGVAGAAGITSDLPAFTVSTGFGYAMGNDAAISPSLAGLLSGQSYDTNSVLVKYTYLGDADLDGDSDLNDLGLWASAFTGDLGNPAIPSTFWTSGDFDYDGDTDLNDLGLWSSTFTGDLGGGAGSLIVVAPGASEGAISALNGMGITVVPEPSTFVLAGIGLAGLAMLRKRRTN